MTPPTTSSTSERRRAEQASALSPISNLRTSISESPYSRAPVSVFTASDEKSLSV
jgi:hypothetical protein